MSRSLAFPSDQSDELSDSSNTGSSTLAVSSKRVMAQVLRHGVTCGHHLLLVGGALAIGMLVTFFLKPELVDRVQQWSPSTTNAVISAPTSKLDAADSAAGLVPALSASVAPNTTRSLTVPNSIPTHVASIKTRPAQTGADRSLQQRWVTQWLSKRYRVAHDATSMMVNASYSTAKEMKLDPLLILAVMAIESGFNPVAESANGAQGLMQVMSSVHHAKFQKLGGVQAALNPIANIKVGSSILKEYVTRGGSIEAGLKMYVGAAAFNTDYGYGARVLAEYSRLKDVATGKQVAVNSSRKGKAKATIEAEVKTDAPAEAEAAAEAAADNNSYPELKQSRLEAGQTADTGNAAL